MIVVKYPNTRAKLLVRQRVEIADDAFAEMVVWQLQVPLAGSRHGFKYRFAFVVRGECVLRYDNEAGKGDHRHAGGREEAYEFTSSRQLAADFFRDIERYRHEHADD
jgi:hypothetical protein